MPFSGAGHLSDQIFHAPGANFWHYIAELCALSFTYPLYHSALTNTMDNLSEMCPLKLTEVCLFLYHQSYTILQAYSPNGFHKLSWPGIELATPRLESQTTKPIRLASRNTIVYCFVKHCRLRKTTFDQKTPPLKKSGPTRKDLGLLKWQKFQTYIFRKFGIFRVGRVLSTIFI